MCFLWLAAIGRPPIPHYAVIPGTGVSSSGRTARATYGRRSAAAASTAAVNIGNRRQQQSPAAWRFRTVVLESALAVIVWYGGGAPPATWRKERWPKNASAPLSGAGVVSLLVGVSD